ncbi:FMN-dependent dehydrogenase family protein [Lineolata rhizophorae]|uniref:Oxidase FUB9 n=1 Tax=Lineolata rhizophorae TaxID=578093 RepID=A0A6A6NT83_9PEZI|nr:FMN-dependent dehydrogenase family protein [Lineolata rhizophorae]
MANRGRTLDTQVFCINDLKEQASKKLPKMYREYFNEGAMDMITENSLRENEKAYDRYRIRPRVLRNISQIDTSTTIFGTNVSFPLGFSPAAMHKLAHPDGEVGTSRAAAAANIPMGLSAYSTDSLEDVISQGTGNPYAMQVSIMKEREITTRVLQRAEAAGYKAIFMTTDAPILGRRLNEFRNCFSPPKGTGFPNVFPGIENVNLEESGDAMAYEDSVEWEEAVTFMRSKTNLPIWAKGVQTGEDVALAIRHGLDGVIVSNHGGRQLDSVPAALDSLRECAPVAKGRIPIAVDSGIRRGTDIFKALALGADFCFTGRIPIWGLAYNGTSGVKLALDLLLDEFKTCMGLAGCRSVKEINRGHLSLLETNWVLSKL